MTWFTNLKIGKKLGLGFGAVLVLMVIQGALSLVQLSKLNGAATDLATNWLPSVKAVGQLRFDAAKVRRWELNSFFAADKAEAQRNFDQALNAVLEDENKYEPMISSDGERRIYQEFRSDWDKHLAVKDRVFELQRQGKEKEAKSLTVTEGLATFNVADKSLADDVTLNNKGGDDSARAAADIYSSSHYWIIALLVGAMVIGFVIAVAIARSMSRAATKMLGVIEEVANNNLAIADIETSEDEIGQAGTALNKMKNSLREIIQSIAGTAEHVASASEEISSSATQQANGAETQKDQTTRSPPPCRRCRPRCMRSRRIPRRPPRPRARPRKPRARAGMIVEDTLTHMRVIAGSVRGTAKKDGGTGQQFRPDRQDHRCDRRHRRPDQSAGAERRHRSRTCRRAGPRLCRGGRRGPQAGRAHHHGHQGNRADDRERAGRDQSRSQKHAGRHQAGGEGRGGDGAAPASR